jgi:hypothetical protein
VTGAAAAALDLWSLGKTLPSGAPAADGPACMMVPIGYSTLAADTLRTHLAAALRDRRSAGTRRLIVEIVGLPHCLTPADVRSLVDFVRSLGAWPVVRLPSGLTSIDHLLGSGVRVVCLDAAGDPQRIAASIGPLLAVAQPAGLRVALLGISSPDLVALAWRSGLDYLGGRLLTAIAPGQPAS